MAYSVFYRRPAGKLTAKQFRRTLVTDGRSACVSAPFPSSLQDTVRREKIAEISHDFLHLGITQRRTPTLGPELIIVFGPYVTVDTS